MLEKTFKELVLNSAENMVSNDLSSKAVCQATIKLLVDGNTTVDFTGKNVNGLIKDTREILVDYTDSVISRVVEAIKVGGDYYVLAYGNRSKLYTNVMGLDYGVLKDTIKLLKGLNQLVKDLTLDKKEYSKVITKLNKIKIKTNARDFNNEFSKAIKDIMKEYKLSDVNGAIVSLENRMTKLWASMDTQQQIDFLAFVNSNLKVSETNELKDTNEELVS